jgi:hypothetical protein
MFHFTGCREPSPMDSGRDDAVLRHQVTPFGNLRVNRVIAANRSLSQRVHVLHRLLAPRHPLCALTNLFSCLKSALKNRRYLSTKIARADLRMKLQYFLPCVRMSKTGELPCRTRDGSVAGPLQAPDGGPDWT